MSTRKKHTAQQRLAFGTKPTAATAWEERYYRLLHIAHGYCSASTCGQDIEGS